jgi:hypothetical protein
LQDGRGSTATGQRRAGVGGGVEAALGVEEEGAGGEGVIAKLWTNQQMQPDYSEQLKAIVAALNHPTTPAWAIAVLSATLGMIGGIFAQTILLRVNDRYQRNRMRRVLYTDLGGYLFMYSTLADQHCKGETKLAWQQDQFEKRIRFSGEDFLRRQPDIYMQLIEHRAAEELYLWLQHMVDKTKMGCSNPDMFCQIFSEYVADGFLPEKYFEIVAEANKPPNS